jgi:hypothetical protein
MCLFQRAILLFGMAWVRAVSVFATKPNRQQAFLSRHLRHRTQAASLSLKRHGSMSNPLPICTNDKGPC